jgi:hypothetical protein
VLLDFVADSARGVAVEPPIRYLPFPSAWSLAEVRRAYAHDAALERNFFGLPPEALALIQQGLDRKAAALTYAKLQAASQPRAAAGVR